MSRSRSSSPVWRFTDQDESNCSDATAQTHGSRLRELDMSTEEASYDGEITDGDGEFARLQLEADMDQGQ